MQVDCDGNLVHSNNVDIVSKLNFVNNTDSNGILLSLPWQPEESQGICDCVQFQQLSKMTYPTESTLSIEGCTVIVSGAIEWNGRDNQYCIHSNPKTFHPGSTKAHCWISSNKFTGSHQVSLHLWTILCGVIIIMLSIALFSLFIRLNESCWI